MPEIVNVSLVCFKGGEASSRDYEQKIENNLKHIFTNFRQFAS